MKSPEVILKKERILSLDVIRGFALLGILIMNIQSFSMIGQAYLNPMAYGDMTGWNKWVWMISHVIADQKFMSIFSMLFGASILMITQKMELQNRSSLGIHYRRNFWLLFIGLIHAYVFWYGDILTYYALCAFILYPFRKLSINALWIIGLLLFSIETLITLWTQYDISQWPPEAIKLLTPGWQPSSRHINAEINAYLGTFWEQMQQRFKTAKMLQTSVFLNHYFWRISGLMLMGMALFKCGFLSAKLHKKVYWRFLFILGPIGLLLVIWGLINNMNAGWSIEYSMFLGTQFNYWGSLLLAIAYISGITLLIKAGFFKKLFARLAAIGRMALSNYLLQTLVCTFIFYGFGLGFFGQVERKYQIIMVLGIWVLQLYLSPIWLRYFRYGPMEWLWRSLTQRKLQAFRRIDDKTNKITPHL